VVGAAPEGGADTGGDDAAAALERDLRAGFDVVETTVRVAGRDVSLLRPRSADELISEADFVRDERLPYWADVWPSSLVLAAHVAAMRGGGRRLVELGCGLGLVAAHAARAGFDVLATDYYEDALRFAALNGRRVAGAPTATRYLDWRDLPADLPRFDLVVASDVLYEPSYAGLVADVFARTLGPRAEGWVADPGRMAAGMFVDECGRRGIQIERAHRVPYADGDIRQTITLYRVWLPSRRPA
jgi:predicted nicotinamide N-methyase